MQIWNKIIEIEIKITKFIIEMGIVCLLLKGEVLKNRK